MKSTLFKANNMAAFTLEMDIHLQNPAKLMDEQMDKVRQIVHQKLKPFHFQIIKVVLSVWCELTNG